MTMQMGEPVVRPRRCPRGSRAGRPRRARWCPRRPGLRRREVRARGPPTEKAMPGGQPSTTTPTAGPWDSPKISTRKILSEAVHGASMTNAWSSARGTASMATEPMASGRAMRMSAPRRFLSAGMAAAMAVPELGAVAAAAASRPRGEAAARRWRRAGPRPPRSRVMRSQSAAREAAHADGQAAGGAQARRDRVAVGQAGRRLDAVADAVAEVELAPLPGLALVARDHARLDLDRARDDAPRASSAPGRRGRASARGTLDEARSRRRPRGPRA